MVLMISELSQRFEEAALLTAAAAVVGYTGFQLAPGLKERGRSESEMGFVASLCQPGGAHAPASGNAGP